jgi:hypothetical protein
MPYGRSLRPATGAAPTTRRHHARRHTLQGARQALTGRRARPKLSLSTCFAKTRMGDVPMKRGAPLRCPPRSHSAAVSISHRPRERRLENPHGMYRRHPCAAVWRIHYNYVTKTMAKADRRRRQPTFFEAKIAKRCHGFNGDKAKGATQARNCAPKRGQRVPRPNAKRPCTLRHVTPHTSVEPSITACAAQNTMV